MNEAERTVELWALSRRLEHAVQCAVGYDKQMLGPEGEKHLRTGINLAMCRNGALSMLLLRKGLITELEYIETLCEAYKDEIKRYKEKYPRYLF